jgi:antitoxin HicB
VLEKAPEGGFVVKFPDVPEALTQGDDKEEALTRAVDALETALEFYTDEGRDLPKARKPKRGQHVVSPSTLTVLKLEVFQAMRDSGVKKTERAATRVRLSQLAGIALQNHSRNIGSSKA